MEMSNSTGYHLDNETTTESFTPPDWFQSTESYFKNPEVFVPCRNPDNLLSAEVASSVELVVHAGVYPVLVLTGVITNVINMAVFVRQGLADRINLCLFSLSVADAGYLSFLMAAKSYTIVGLFDEEAGSYWQQRYLNTVLGPLGGFLNVSNAMTTVIAVERCICIVAPFRAKRLLKTRYMAFVILSLYIYVLGVFGFLNVKYVTVPLPPNDASSNVTRYISRLSQFYVRNPVLIDVVCNYLLAVVIPATSLVVIIITTSVTVNKLRASLAWKRQETTAAVTSGERREAAVTTMLVMVCCVYVICMTPSVTLAFVRNLIPDFLPTGRYCNAFKVATALVHTCEVVNSSANFFIYFFRGTRYRTTLRRLCCCTKEGTTKPDVTDASSSSRY